MSKEPLKGGDALEGAKPSTPADTSLSNLAMAAQKGMNQVSGDIGEAKVEVVTASSVEVPTTRDPLDGHIRPEGEARVDRTTPKTDPEFYYAVVETKIPQGWGTTVPLDAALANGYELAPGEDPAKQIRVRVRIPYTEYRKRLREGEQKSEERRRAKQKGASVDKTERTRLPLMELFANQSPDVEAANQIASERMTDRQ